MIYGIKLKLCYALAFIWNCLIGIACILTLLATVIFIIFLAINKSAWWLLALYFAFVPMGIPASLAIDTSGLEQELKELKKPKKRVRVYANYEVKKTDETN